MKVSAIIPVYNEEKTVGSVIETLLNNPLIHEVICVNDGSTDNSLSILESFGDRIYLISLPINKGKGYALSVGIQKAKGEIVAFFDADLINFKQEHIEHLLKPILQGKTRAVLGQFTNSGFLGNLFKNITGERAYYRQDLLPCIKELKMTGFGAEVYLNNMYKNGSVIKVPLEGLDLLLKHEKHGRRKAIRGWTKEAAEIVTELAKQENLIPRNYHVSMLMEKLTKNPSAELFKELLKKTTKKW